MSPEAMQAQAKQDWNASARPPLADWLSDARGTSHGDRLASLGNVVLPKCAQLGMHLLVHSIRGDA